MEKIKIKDIILKKRKESGSNKVLSEKKEAEQFLKRTSVNNDGKYVTNEELRHELRLSHEQGEPTKRLHLQLFLIAVKFSNNKSFYKYPIKYDAIKECYMQCVKYWRKFDMEMRTSEGHLCSPFSYFTQTCYHKFIELIKKDNQRKKNNYYLRMGNDKQYYSIDEFELDQEQKNKERTDYTDYVDSQKNY